MIPAYILLLALIASLCFVAHVTVAVFGQPEQAGIAQLFMRAGVTLGFVMCVLVVRSLGGSS